MKTSVIEVRDMLSVLSVIAVEERIGEVSGVESVTVNYAAGTATVRYDETRLDVADIRSAVRQQGHESGEPAAASPNDGHKGHAGGGGPPAGGAPAAPKTVAVAPAKAGADSKDAAQQNIAAPPAAPSLEGAAAPKPSATAPTPATPQPTAAAAEKQHGDMGSHKR